MELRGNKMIRWSSDQQWIRRGQERQLGEKSLRSPGSTPPARRGQWLGRFGMLEGGNVFIDMGVGRVKGGEWSCLVKEAMNCTPFVNKCLRSQMHSSSDVKGE